MPRKESEEKTMLVCVCVCEKLKTGFCRLKVDYNLLQQILRKEQKKPHKPKPAKSEASRASKACKEYIFLKTYLLWKLKNNFYFQ